MQKNLENIQEYYGKVLESKSDLKTSACCSGEQLSPDAKPVFKLIHDEILDKFYGCGSPIPPNIKDLKVLDLGCGTGRDVYIISKLVGENGFVTGVDMTDEQLNTAKKHIDYQMKQFEFSKTNVEFKKGYIEDLKALNIKDESIDLVVSNCVLNLSPTKKTVFEEIFRVLKPGGELYFSDIFSASRIPAELFNDPVLHGECLSGAMYIEDFRRILENLGCKDYRILNNVKLEVTDPEIKEKIKGIDFYTITVRAFKIDGLEDRNEDYGQSAVYKGTINNYPEELKLDFDYNFKKGEATKICGNTAKILEKSRFAPHFDIIGDQSKHYGLFKQNQLNLLPSLSEISSCC